MSIANRALNKKPMPTTAAGYERALQRAEATYRRNKSRMWVLEILRAYLAEEAEQEASQ